MTPDELQAAIERAEAKARELGGLEAASTPAMKAFTMLPRAAEAYRRQITLGLEGEPCAALKSRLICESYLAVRSAWFQSPMTG